MLALGDLNGYTRKDPIDVLVQDDDLVDLAAPRIADSGRYIWHINVDDPDAFSTRARRSSSPHAYADSDHDPSVVGLETGVDADDDPLISGSGETADRTVFDFAITGTKKNPAGRAASVSGTSTIAGDITCLRLVHDWAGVFGIADTESGGQTVFR